MPKKVRFVVCRAFRYMGGCPTNRLSRKLVREIKSPELVALTVFGSAVWDDPSASRSKAPRPQMRRRLSSYIKTGPRRSEGQNSERFSAAWVCAFSLGSRIAKKRRLGPPRRAAQATVDHH